MLTPRHERLVVVADLERLAPVDVLAQAVFLPRGGEEALQVLAVGVRLAVQHEVLVADHVEQHERAHFFCDFRRNAWSASACRREPYVLSLPAHSGSVASSPSRKRKR